MIVVYVLMNEIYHLDYAYDWRLLFSVAVQDQPALGLGRVWVPT